MAFAPKKEGVTSHDVTPPILKTTSLLICSIQAFPAKNILKMIGQTALQWEWQVLILVTKVIKVDF